MIATAFGAMVAIAVSVAIGSAGLFFVAVGLLFTVGAVAA